MVCVCKYVCVQVHASHGVCVNMCVCRYVHPMVCVQVRGQLWVYVLAFHLAF